MIIDRALLMKIGTSSGHTANLDNDLEISWWVNIYRSVDALHFKKSMKQNYIRSGKR